MQEMKNSVLVVDDEPNFCTSLKALLGTEGYVTDISHSGQEAIFRLNCARYDAILLDIGLPDISGLELSESLKEQYPDTVIIILTGFATLENAVQSLRNGVYDYLSKPVDHQQLFHTLSRGIEHNQLKRRLFNSEKRFRQLATATWEGIAIYEGGKLLQANSQLCEMFGYEERELLGQQCFDVLLDHNSIHSNHVNPEPETIGPFEAIGIRKDNSRFPVEIRVKALDYSNRSTQVAAIRDVTANRQAMERQLALQQKLADAKRMETLGLMAGAVAHDLNNILAGIIIYPELLLLDLPADFSYRKEIKMIQEAGKRAAAVVNDLLTVARGANCKKEVHNLNSIVSEYIHSVEYKELSARNPGLTISTEMDGQLKNTCCSTVHITKLIMNLVNNAAEAIKETGRIIIRTRNCCVQHAIDGYEKIEAGEYILLEVEDDGHGISDTDLPHIFDPFYSKKVLGRSGTGLGLAVVRNTLIDHGGYFDLKSSEQGTVFRLYFPISHEDIGDLVLMPSMDTCKGSGEVILVVDDQESQREIARRLLFRLGYTVHTVGSGEEAIEFIKMKPVDLVMLDMIMTPGINGCETYQRIIRYNPDQKAIIATGYSSEADIHRAKKLGINHFVKKPYSLHELGQVLRLEIS